MIASDVDCFSVVFYWKLKETECQINCYSPGVLMLFSCTEEISRSQTKAKNKALHVHITTCTKQSEDCDDFMCLLFDRLSSALILN